MHRLSKGFERFQREVYPRYEGKFRGLAKGQEPHAMVITCADSRVLPSLFLQADPGDLFIYRNVGNIVPAYDGSASEVGAAIEYAVDVLRVQDIVICGHSDCGAMKGVMHPEKIQEYPIVARWLRRAERARRISRENAGGFSDEAFLRCVTEENVLAQLDNLGTHPAAAAAMARGELELYGWFYDIGDGTLACFDPAMKRFVEFHGDLPAATPAPRWGRRHTAA
ncbi:MAG TPA: carbonic anhydrase [Bryobacteraceae bacterium]|nr:carbonic anhydrase [Bryobacteraceae bacterium]